MTINGAIPLGLLFAVILVAGIMLVVVIGGTALIITALARRKP